ncbi:excisionase [Prauserella marina]|uniref:DNA binding domain-containing protein, excisionase family n=1 Tax=Prauserella marina TaxID=530584 RepID=A0A222VVL3_9PSEU|nr:helix-turn-helix domain-containing protein [Prauserella marina]ASR37969.1 excisionase [Prauserella marina]PWV73194.1 AlpA family transcriptional regulator [Prauserella marina]SDD69658.1 DNA binding domain-containing protein, excisionase family [Prauserella marina]
MNKLLTVDELADYLNIPKNTLYQWRTKGYGPTGVRIGKHVRYRADDVDTWIERQGAI